MLNTTDNRSKSRARLNESVNWRVPAQSFTPQISKENRPKFRNMSANKNVRNPKFGSVALSNYSVRRPISVSNSFQINSQVHENP